MDTLLEVSQMCPIMNSTTDSVIHLGFLAKRSSISFTHCFGFARALQNIGFCISTRSKWFFEKKKSIIHTHSRLTYEMLTKLNTFSCTRKLVFIRFAWQFVWQSTAMFRWGTGDFLTTAIVFHQSDQTWQCMSLWWAHFCEISFIVRNVSMGDS